jgi:hypothetical protein
MFLNLERNTGSQSQFLDNRGILTAGVCDDKRLTVVQKAHFRSGLQTFDA